MNEPQKVSISTLAPIRVLEEPQAIHALTTAAVESCFQKIITESQERTYRVLRVQSGAEQFSDTYARIYADVVIHYNRMPVAPRGAHGLWSEE